MRIRSYYTIVWLIICASIGVSDAHATSLFGSSETESGDLHPFPKWTGVMRRQPPDMKKMAADCSSKSCIQEKWDAFIESVQGASQSEQIRLVNSYYNKSPYIEDSVNWGMNDYWETLYEFLRKHGDCEDYAISKYFTLRKLGFDADDLRIVVLKDRNLGVMHSVLAVYQGGTILILDNQFSSVVDHKKIKHYEPVYSINEDNWWRHRL